MISYMGSLNVNFNDLKLKKKRCIPQSLYPHLKCSAAQHGKTVWEKLIRSERQIDWQKLRQTIWADSTGENTSWVEEKQENLVEIFKELFKKSVD